MLIVVIDTNILINAGTDVFSFTRKIIDLVREGAIRAIASRQTLHEHKGILSAQVNNQSWRGVLDEYFDSVEYVSVPYRTGEDTIVTEDPEDEKFIRLAIEGHASYIITEDRHLLEIEEYEGVKILTPKDFWYEYKSLAGDGKENQEWADWMKQIMGR